MCNPGTGWPWRFSGGGGWFGTTFEACGFPTVAFIFPIDAFTFPTVAFAIPTVAFTL